MELLRTQPTHTAFSQPWFDACNAGRLLIQRCESCAEYQFYPRILCSHCGAAKPAWVEAAGQADIVSFTVVRRAVSKAYSAPYVVALVRLVEGPTMMSQIVDADPEGISIGDRVDVQFEAWDEDQAMPVFTLSKKQEVKSP